MGEIQRRELESDLAPEVAEAAGSFMRAARSQSTIRAYAGDVRRFEAWCRAHGRLAFPASQATVVSYVTWLATTGHANPRTGEARPSGVSTIERALAAISKAHQLAGLPSEVRSTAVSEVMRGLIRSQGGVKKRRKRPLLREEILTLARLPGDSLHAKRDRCLLLLGWACALRRAELVTIRFEDLERTKAGTKVRIPLSKADQDGRNARELHVKADTQVHQALEDWLACSGISSGPIFRGIRNGTVLPGRLTPRLVAEITKREALKHGLDPALFAGHSLRTGWVTQAAQDGLRIDEIMNQTGHRNADQVLEYIRQATGFTSAAARVAP